MSSLDWIAIDVIDQWCMTGYLYDLFASYGPDHKHFDESLESAI